MKFLFENPKVDIAKNRVNTPLLFAPRANLIPNKVWRVLYLSSRQELFLFREAKSMLIFYAARE